MIKKNKLYLTTSLVCSFGFVWFLLNYFQVANIAVCPVKHVTGYPCPSCGSTRAITELFHGHIKEAILINPLGIITFLIGVTIVFMMIYDLIFRKKSFFNAYVKMESFLQHNKFISILLIILVICNWIWNIKKGL